MEALRTVLVSAGAAGIGRCIAEHFLAAGYGVHVCDIATAAIEEFIGANPAATATLGDVSDPLAVERIYEDLLHHHGRLDVLVNNAGVAGPTANVDAMPIEGWKACLAVNLDGLFFMTRRGVPLLRAAGGGSIINLSSNAGTYPFAGRSPYTASKWATIGLTRSWAMELGADRIRVNALCPGSVNGPRIDGVIERHAAEVGSTPERIRAIYLRQSSLGVFVEAEDIAHLALFLASEEGRYISGQAIGVDGHTEGLAVHID